MNNNNTEHSHANISPLRRVSGLWLIPIVTVITGLWLIYENWSSQGPLITISFESAEGLQEGKTKSFHFSWIKDTLTFTCLFLFQNFVRKLS